MLAARKSNAETKKISPVLTFPRGLAYKIVTIIKITKMIGLNEGTYSGAYPFAFNDDFLVGKRG